MHVFAERTSPQEGKTIRAWVGTLQGLGFTRVRGVQARPVLMKRSFVHQVLLQEAVRAVTSNTEPTLDFIPDMAGVGEPKWTYEENQTAEESQREAAKADNTGKRKSKVRSGAKIGRAKLQVRRLTAERALAAVHWTEAERR